MSGNLAKVIDISSESGPDLKTWEDWLRSQLIEDWRQGEWNAESMLFTGDVDNPRTAGWLCITEGCTVVQKARAGRCTACANAFRASGLSEEEFKTVFRPAPNRSYTDVDTCSVERNGVRCPREYHSVGLCRNHSVQWIKASRAAARRRPFDGTLEEWMRDVAIPFKARLDKCQVLACTLEQMAIHSGLCRVHTRRWREHCESVDHDPDLSGWIAHETPYLSAHQFSLAPLSKLGRLEVLYAIQQRDLRNQYVDPGSLRSAIQRLTGVPSLLAGGPEVFEPSRPTGRNVEALIRDIGWTINQGYDQLRGIEPTDKLVWDMKAVGNPTTFRNEGPRNRSGSVDFSVIRQPWLREAVMEWARSTRPASDRFRRHVLACTVTSKVLSRLPGGGMDPTELRFAEMNLVVDAFRDLRKEDGELQTSSNRGAQLTALFTVLDFGRSAGLLDDLHGTFSRHSAHRIVREESNEDEIGKAIPESVIRQLDSHLEGLGRDFPYRGYSAADIEAMLQTVYRVMRDTGRRPREVASLKRDCLEFADKDCFLVWNNYKSKRHRRRLPITRETAADLQAWAKRRESLVAAPARSGAYLFPAISETSRYPHMESGVFSRALRQWVQSLESIHSEGTGQNGLPVPFDREKIFPYAFRHSYAQRHADAGVPIDVLKELMDHKSANTTARYYKVSLKRKQEAVKKMRLHVVDREGNPAPMASNKAYELRSVAVPFGGCTEPSNVKAGGQACPIRFQCAGCGFYRPDPSYLASIEDQIRDLKADKETALAMGTAEYVIRNLQDQIDSFKQVAENMRKQIEKLPEQEREELMESVKVLRKTRAAMGRTMLPLTVINNQESSA
ncbi:tyrosine-type recombinase/integrase [Streptomyces sp. NPDC055103]